MTSPNPGSLRFGDVVLEDNVLTGSRGRLELDRSAAGILGQLLATPGIPVEFTILTAAFGDNASLVEMALPRMLKHLRQIVPAVSREKVSLRMSPAGSAIAITKRKSGPFKAEA